VNSVPLLVSVPKIHEIQRVARLDLCGATALLEHLVFAGSLEQPESLTGSHECPIDRARRPDVGASAAEIQ
jgi:hypothetical protein